MTARAIVAREHVACTVFSNRDVQDRTRRLFAGMSEAEQQRIDRDAIAFCAREEHRKRLQSEWDGFRDEYEIALAEDRRIDAARYQQRMELLNIELNDLEGVP